MALVSARLLRYQEDRISPSAPPRNHAAKGPRWHPRAGRTQRRGPDLVAAGGRSKGEGRVNVGKSREKTRSKPMVTMVKQLDSAQFLSDLMISETKFTLNIKTG